MKNRNLKNHDCWMTPPDFYDKLNKEFSFDFDPCPYVCPGEPILFDGLSPETLWGDRNFINPPYSMKLKGAFVRRAIKESEKGKLCVCLLPVSTSTRLFHDVILPAEPEIRFIKGRLSFHGYNTKGEWSTKGKGMHDSMIVIFDGRKKN